MAKKSKHVRRFLRAAAARLEEAGHLRPGGFSLAAVYLAGYAVECMLKALALSAHPEHQQPAVIDLFRGTRAHDYGWLIGLYRDRGNPPPPADVLTALADLKGWETGLRYTPGTKYDGDEDDFFAAAGVVLAWADRRV